jgi:D-alanine-D-alanine ligase
VRKLRILALMHPDLVPPESIGGMSKDEVAPFITEYNVVHTLKKLGHDVFNIGVYDDLSVIRHAIEKVKPHIAFNLLEEFGGHILLDQNVVSYLELMRLPYTGCNPRGLVLSRDKALSKKILHYHRILVPEFMTFPRGRAKKRIKKPFYPMIVKSLLADASAGISQASVVDNDDKLMQRVDFIHRRIGTDAIAERYIPGRELYVGVFGNSRLKVFPPWELIFSKMPAGSEAIATESVKWDLKYQKRHGITSRRVRDLSPELLKTLESLSRRVYKRLQLNGYARIDYRLDSQGNLYVLEANANPQIAKDEDFALSAKAAGLDYPTLLQRILSLGLRASA